MKKSTICIIISILALTAASPLSAQNYRSSYSTNGDSVYYDGRPIREADWRSFQILGHGYAKDANHVYLDGRILEYVDPYGFRIMDNPRRPAPADEPGLGFGPKPQHEVHHDGPGNNDRHGKRGYFKSKWDVFYDGRKIEDAQASTFVELEHGYAKDAFNVYFKGLKIEGAIPSKFVIDHDGYAHDTFGTYYFGKRISD